jgi:hypothetical protein
MWIENQIWFQEQLFLFNGFFSNGFLRRLTWDFNKKKCFEHPISAHVLLFAFKYLSP